MRAWGEYGWHLGYVSGLLDHFYSKRKGKSRAVTV